jgi:hypothetical protein
VVGCVPPAAKLTVMVEQPTMHVVITIYWLAI